MTDYIDQPAAEEPVAPAPEPPAQDPRVLTPEESDAYAARLGSVGFTFTVAGIGGDPVGFDVTGNGAIYGYRYDGSAQTAVALMDRICAERGA